MNGQNSLSIWFKNTLFFFAFFAAALLLFKLILILITNSLTGYDGNNPFDGFHFSGSVLMSSMKFLFTPKMPWSAEEIFVFSFYAALIAGKVCLLSCQTIKLSFLTSSKGWSDLWFYALVGFIPAFQLLADRIITAIIAIALIMWVFSITLKESFEKGETTEPEKEMLNNKTPKISFGLDIIFIVLLLHILPLL
jgi:hypothetical protein